MEDWISFADSIPEEREIVEYKTCDDFTWCGFYILPYRKYPNSYFNPFKFASWCFVDPVTGNWCHVEDKPVMWRKTDRGIPKGKYLPSRRWFPNKG